MFCTKCGAALAAQSPFCKFCGTATGASVIAAREDAPPPSAFEHAEKISSSPAIHPALASGSIKNCSTPQLTDLEISFLRMLDGKPVTNIHVLGWWCAFNNIDGPGTIKKLCTNGYLTEANYKFRVKKATIPVLKGFLTKRGLSTKGKKADLVNRIIANICEADCLAYFTTSYWSFTSRALELLREDDLKAQQEYERIIDLIRSGSYDTLKAHLYPNKNEHWATEDTFYDTIDFVMKHGFEGFGLTETDRRNVASFVAAQAVDYCSRGSCLAGVSQYLQSINLALDGLRPPKTLSDYAQRHEIRCEDMYDIYIRFVVDRARAIADGGCEALGGSAVVDFQM